jgi:carbon-monoxide dehydrogenase small subunit
MIMVSADFLRHQPQPTRGEIEQALEGNLCRCTGYLNIVEAVSQAAQHMQKARP